MEVKTKFNIGDWVWAMVDNLPRQHPIERIDIAVSGETHIIYTLGLCASAHDRQRSERDLYSTKEELMKAIFE